jgi:hypothetical protein
MQYYTLWVSAKGVDLAKKSYLSNGLENPILIVKHVSFFVIRLDT